ncbi:MAG: YceI family protein [Bacteroidota bacterium]
MEIEGAESKASFSVKKLGFITVTGDLSNISGTIHFDPDDLSSCLFDINVPTSTINTNNEKRDEHLRTQDFFFVEQHPDISFQSTVVGQENGHYFTSGNLHLLGTTQEVKLPFSFEEGVFKGDFSLNRFDYALGKKFPSFFVGKTVQISIHCKTKT